MELKLKEYRLKNKLSQVKLAEKIGVTDALIRNYESGKIMPPLEKIDKLSQALNVSVSKLLGLNTSPYDNLFELLSPKDKKYFETLKKHYELMYQLKENHCFSVDELENDITNKLLSVGFENAENIINLKDLTMLNDLLSIVITLREYLEDDENKDNNPYYKILKSQIKSFAYFNINGNIDDKL